MSGTKPVAEAQRDADAARARLSATLEQIQAQLAPSRIMEETMDTVRTGSAELARNAAEVARERPGVVAGAAAAGALLLLRKPLARLFRRKKETSVPHLGLATDAQKG
jgi:ElaB/YqjD/DUF883 family membrane-anchored ribosome-binding protein